jgi:hypothetical protein
MGITWGWFEKGRETLASEIPFCEYARKAWTVQLSTRILPPIGISIEILIPSHVLIAGWKHVLPWAFAEALTSSDFRRGRKTKPLNSRQLWMNPSVQCRVYGSWRFDGYDRAWKAEVNWPTERDKQKFGGSNGRPVPIRAYSALVEA